MPAVFFDPPFTLRRHRFIILKCKGHLMTTAENILANLFLTLAMAAYMAMGALAVRYALRHPADNFFVKLRPRTQKLCVAGMFVAAAAAYMLVAAFGAGYNSDLDWYKSWGDYVLQHGIYDFYRDCDADYPPLFLYINTALTWFSEGTHLSARFVYKAFFGLATVGTAVPLYFIVKRRADAFCAAVFTALYLLAPVNLADSAAWGQSDTVIGGAAIIIYDFLSREKWIPFFAALLVAMLLKTQIILLLPAAGLYLVYLMIKKRLYLKFIACAAGTAALYALMYLPFGMTYIREGRWLFLLDIFARQVGHYPYLSVNASNFWMMIGLNDFSTETGIGAVLKYAAYAATIAVSVLIFIAVIKSRAEKGTKLALMLALQGTACYLFLPAMHERYWVPVAGVLIIALTLCKNYRMCLYGFGMICGQGLNIVAILLAKYGMFQTYMLVLAVIVTAASSALFAAAAYRKLFPKAETPEGMAQTAPTGGADDAAHEEADVADGIPPRG